MKYDIVFWNPGFRPKDNGHSFGCATLGCFSGDNWIEPDDARIVKWRALEGRACGGSFEEMLQFAKKSETAPKMILVFLTGNAGNDAFVRALTACYPGVPVLGGSSAADAQTAGQVLPEGENGAILLVDEDGFRASGKYIHRRLDIDLQVVEAEPRLLKKLRVDGEEMTAKAYFDWMRRIYGRDCTDFESITVQTPRGKNIHCSQGEGEYIIAGSDVEGERLYAVEIPRADAQAAMADFMSRPKALAIGCAGLKSMLQDKIEGQEGNVGVFLFGEVVPTEDGTSRFANLMLGRME